MDHNKLKELQRRKTLNVRRRNRVQRKTMNVPAILGLVGLIAFLLAAILLYICKKRLGVEPQKSSSASASIVNREGEEWDAV